MAAQGGTSLNQTISPQVISGIFVQQYYHSLHESPDQVHKFYQDTSILGRQDSNGAMVSVTTLREINEKIMSVDFRNGLTEIESADAQSSHNDGVLIVVTGSLTSSEGICRRFTQTFFLAPQESGGYFVLNDVFRFIAERPPAEINQLVVKENGHAENNQTSKSASETEPTPVNKSVISGDVAVENSATDKQVTNSTVDDAAVDDNVTVTPPVQVVKEDATKTLVAAPPPPTTQTDVTKKSYASIVKVMKEARPPVAKPSPSVVKTKPSSKPVSKVVEGSEKPSAKPTLAVETAPTDGNVVENNSSQTEQGYSVFIKSLPFNATAQMVEEEFKKFGSIKPGGIQVRNSKTDRFCFGFIEYESQQSMQAAIEASPVHIGDKEVYVEEKRTGTRVVNGVIITRGDNGRGGHFQSGRGVYHGDNFRGRGGGYANNGNYRGGDNFNRRNDRNFSQRNDNEYFNHGNDEESFNDGDNYSQRNNGENLSQRNDFRNRNDFSGRGRGPPPGRGYHQNGNGFRPSRPLQNGSGRFARVRE